MEKMADKLGTVESLFHIDFAKLNVPAMCVRDPEFLGEAADDKKASTPTAGSVWEMPWAAKYDSKPEALSAVLSDGGVQTTLSGFYSGFPGSTAATKGRKKNSYQIKDSSMQRVSLLQACGVEEHKVEAKGLDQQLDIDHVAAWGNGDNMLSYGMETMQLACLKLQTQGFRQVVLFPLNTVRLYLESLHSTPVSMGGILDFVMKLQPSAAAALIHACGPNVVQHVFLNRNTCLYVPAGWIICEKVLNHNCAFGLRVSFVIAAARDSQQVDNLKACCEMLRMAKKDEKEIERMQAVIDSLQAVSK